MKLKYLIKIIAISFVLCGCYNVTDFSYKDAKRHSYIFSFVKGTNVIDGKHDIDADLVEMYLEVENDSLYLNHCDSIANEDNWEPLYSSKQRRIYLKDIPFQGGGENIEILIASIYKPDTIKIKFQGI